MTDLTELKAKTVAELLTLYAAINEEMRDREIIRSANNPTGDYAEYLFCQAFGWQQFPNAEKGFDAKDNGMPPPKAVCRDLVISFKSMAYVMRYSNFPH